MQSKPVYRRGFTLIELSIVLVIIGLLVGSVLVGRDLIRASEVRKVYTDLLQYMSAANAFKMKYGSMPGDYRLATVDITGAAGNGNGNDIITHWTETFLFWNHLALAGMIPGSYSGAAGGGNLWDAVIGTNVPGGVRDSGYMILVKHNVSSNFFYGNDGEMGFAFGVDDPISYTYRPMARAAEMKQMDDKFDDGLQVSGKIQSLSYALNPSCGTSTDATVTVYNISATRPYCSFWFKYQ